MSDYTKDRWDLNGFNVSEIIVVRDGPAPDGKTYRDGRHQISIAHFERLEDAKRARECVNAMAGIDDPVAWMTEAEDVLVRLADYMDRYSDVSDGDYGEPEANKEMLLLSAIKPLLGRIGGGE